MNCCKRSNNSTTNERRTATWTRGQVWAALIVSIPAMAVHYSAAFTPRAFKMVDEFSNASQALHNVTTNQKSMIGHYHSFFAIFGALAGGPLTELVGQKSTMAAAGPPIIIAWLFIAAAHSVQTIYFGRCVGGFCIGTLSLCIPIYLGEILHPKVRGSLGLFPVIFGNTATLICYLLSKKYTWKGLAIAGSIIPVPYLILLYFIPETPRWYISIHERENAEESLQWFRGSEEDIAEELSAKEKVQLDDKIFKKDVCMKNMFKKRNAKPTAICMGLMFFQQASGISIVIYYIDKLIKYAQGSAGTHTSAVVLGNVSIFASVLSALLVDRIGRKILLYISGLLMALALFTMGAYSTFKSNTNDVTNDSWLPLTTFVIYMFGFSLGFGPIPWLIMGEILPARIRYRAAALVTAFHWVLMYAVITSFILFEKTIGKEVFFFIYGFFCIMAVIFTYSAVPETMKQSLEDLENLWKDTKSTHNTPRRVIPALP